MFLSPKNYAILLVSLSVTNSSDPSIAKQEDSTAATEPVAAPLSANSPFSEPKI